MLKSYYITQSTHTKPWQQVRAIDKVFRFSEKVWDLTVNWIVLSVVLTVLPSANFLNSSPPPLSLASSIHILQAPRSLQEPQRPKVLLFQQKGQILLLPLHLSHLPSSRQQPLIPTLPCRFLLVGSLLNSSPHPLSFTFSILAEKFGCLHFITLHF